MKGTTEVTIVVEPADEQRSALALWLLERDPDIRTVSHRAFAVPAALFQDAPAELLDGALVDGHVFRSVVDGLVPHGDGYAQVAAPADVVPVNDGAQPEPLSAPVKAVQPRQRTRARKAADK